MIMKIMIVTTMALNVPRVFASMIINATTMAMHACVQGEPVWDIQPHTLEEVKDLSLNFFFLLPVSDARESHIRPTSPP